MRRPPLGAETEGLEASSTNERCLGRPPFPNTRPHCHFWKIKKIYLFKTCKRSRIPPPLTYTHTRSTADPCITAIVMATCNKEERGEGVVRGREVCAQRDWKWDSARAASFAKEEQKPNCCAGCVCLRGSAMCFSLAILFLAHAALTRVWADQQTGEPCLFSLSS